jgi:ADP-ribosylglycohydrolase
MLRVAGSAAAASLSPRVALADKQQRSIFASKAMGCFMGAAIADAMGGAVECQHYKRIAKYFPDFQEHQPFDNPPATIFKLRPGYALDAAPGSVTDDTLIRMVLAKYLLANLHRMDLE